MTRGQGMTRPTLAEARRWVIKIGSSLVTNQGLGLDHERIAGWAAQIDELLRQGREVVLVSSGAVAEGRARLGQAARPSELSALQATAAVGQMGLIHAYETAFRVHARQTAQVLLTHDDVRDRGRYLNARQALLRLLSWQVLPVVNENDTVATDEIRLGDNDTLGALTANLIQADLLVILTDQDGLFEADPRVQPDAPLVSEAELSDSRLMAMAGSSKGELGRGGMRTKLTAAYTAARSGAATIIAHGRQPDVLGRLRGGEALGTLLKPAQGVMAARKRWIAGQLQLRGRVQLDEGAARVLREQGRSLLPVGVRSVTGDFARGDLIACVDADGAEVARGLSNYDAADARRLVGARSDEISGRLGRPGEPELIHRDNLVLAG